MSKVQGDWRVLMEWSSKLAGDLWRRAAGLKRKRFTAEDTQINHSVEVSLCFDQKLRPINQSVLIHRSIPCAASAQDFVADQSIYESIHLQSPLHSSLNSLAPPQTKYAWLIRPLEFMTFQPPHLALCCKEVHRCQAASDCKNKKHFHGAICFLSAFYRCFVLLAKAHS